MHKKRGRKPKNTQSEAMMEGQKVLWEMADGADGAAESGEEEAPKVERFTSNSYPTLSVAVGRKYVRFRNGEFTTDDPEIIRALVEHSWFKVHIHSDNLERYR